MSGRPVWLVLADPLSARVFVDCGIVDGLRRAFGSRLRPVLLFGGDIAEAWTARLGGRSPIAHEALFPARVPPVERVLRRTDRWLDERVGYYPLAIRLNYREGFHLDRMRPGHANWLLDSARVGPLPRWRVLERSMRRWHFSRRRYASRALVERLGGERPAIVFTNLQMQSAVPFVVAGRRLGLPLVGYVASWDHTVGKGVIPPQLDLYLVQNSAMRDDLVRYHGVDRARIVVTGWPQTDVFHEPRPREAYAQLVSGLGLDPDRPLVLVMGNTPTNAPYEGRLVERLVRWRDEAHGGRGAQLLFRPHPRDREWRERFGAAVGHTGAAVQEPSFTDLEALATLLQHASCVVSNAGTILLDALVNGRPAVCVAYDEGAPPGESWAAMNLAGEHYREVRESGAFHVAERFEEVTAGIDRTLERPQELAERRRAVVRRVVGEVDGRAAERVVGAVAGALDGAEERSQVGGRPVPREVEAGS